VSSFYYNDLKNNNFIVTFPVCYCMRLLLLKLYLVSVTVCISTANLLVSLLICVSVPSDLFTNMCIPLSFSLSLPVCVCVCVCVSDWVCVCVDTILPCVFWKCSAKSAHHFVKQY